MKYVPHILRKSAARWWRADPTTLGAALSFYAIFSLTPLLLFLLVILGKFLPATLIEDQVLREVYIYGGRSVAAAVAQVFVSTESQSGGLIATILGGAVVLIGCLGMFSQV